MPDMQPDDTRPCFRQLTKKEVVKAAARSGIIGLVLFTLGLELIIAVGVLGTMSGGGFQAIAIGLGCVVLLLPSAVILGVGIAGLSCSVGHLYALLVGKPVYSVAFHNGHSSE